MLPARGRPGLQLLMTIKRELNGADLLRLTQGTHVRVTAPPIQKLRAVHHQIAQLLASGKGPKEISLIVNRGAQRIGDLQRDPQFQNLIAYYQAQKNEIAIDRTNAIQEGYVDVLELSLGEIVDRLEDPVKLAQIPISELRQLAGDAASRTLAPQKTAQPIQNTPTHITFNMGTRDLRPKVPDGSTNLENQPEEALSIEGIEQ